MTDDVANPILQHLVAIQILAKGLDPPARVAVDTVIVDLMAMVVLDKKKASHNFQQREAWGPGGVCTQLLYH